MDELLNICCAIMAGGQSRRMGLDKTTVDIGGEPMLVRSVRQAKQVCMRVIVVGRPAPRDWPASISVEFIPDAGPALSGPIVGIRTALIEVKHSILVMACDMPLVTSDLLRRLYAAHRANNMEPVATVAVTQNPSGTSFAEPLFAIYTPLILPLLEEWIDSGKRSLQQILQAKNVHLWTIPENVTNELMNVNDSQTLALALRRLSGSSGDPQ